MESSEIIESLIAETFKPEVMEIVSSDHHKNRDGDLSISFNYYTDDWYISHEGYVRDRIEATGKTLKEAAAKFTQKIRCANKAVVLGRS